MKNRIYVIKYKLYKGFSGKYELNPESEIITLYYDKFQRDEFIKKYLKLTSSVKKDIYYDNVKCYTALLEEIEDMESIINAI